MTFLRKIYFNNKPLILTNNMESLRHTDHRVQGYMHRIGAFARNFRQALDYLGTRQSMGAVIEDISPQALDRGIAELFTPIDAAGGVVQNERGDVLMIYRRGRWDLPKGKCDDGEADDACALREVTEETGLNTLALGDFISHTYHLYTQHGQQLLKKTSWYHMTANSSAALVPQAEENIEEARWIAREDLSAILFKTYEAVAEVVRSALHTH